LIILSSFLSANEDRDTSGVTNTSSQNIPWWHQIVQYDVIKRGGCPALILSQTTAASS